jgi:orotidine-5'-phosphate decarboxylase
VNGFGDRVARTVADRRSQLLLGLDPPADVAAEGRLAEWCEALIGAAGGSCAGVKIQLACFERAGAAGWAAYERVAATAAGEGLLVLADAKRGDVDVSAAAYADAFLRPPVDAMTVSAALGGDSLAPMLAAAAERGAGLFALVRTSNPGAADLQDLALADGRPWHMAVADLVARLGAPSVGESGLSSLGAVVGATVPERISALRAAMPAQILLVPGVGAQGGRAEALGAAFGGRAAGALVPVSRGIAAADDPAAAAAGLREALWRTWEESSG